MSPEWILVPVGYLLGAVPFGLLYSRILEGEDVRERGSGNVGATNVLRAFGWAPGVITLLLDVLKGLLPVALALRWSPGVGPAVVTGVAAIVGHVYPVYLRFDGGKGVATSAGVFALLAPKALLGALVLFLVGVGSTRYMSVGSLTGAVSFPLIAAYLYGPTAPVTAGATAGVVLIVWRHRANLKRLVRGEEHPFF